ncbi:MAG: hypothetical protein M3448_06810 [Pseudomonadota bacterium]|nr:hypothetical protein [Pseudomonadota bacterium]
MRAFAAFAMLMLAACSEAEPTVIDGSSPESFERTTSEARRDLPDADRLLFDRALRTIGGRQHSARDPDQLARVTFDGMTAAEVIDDQSGRETKEQ